MSKIFLSYRFTGEDPNQLNEILRNINSKLTSKGYDVFCSFLLENYFREREMSIEQIYNYCLREQESCDIFMPLINSNHRSSGMELELEKAKELRQRQILLIRKGLEFTQFRNSSYKVIEYETFFNYIKY